LQRIQGHPVHPHGADGIKLGKTVILVVEKLEELKQIIAVSRQVGVEPLLGIRIRLSSKGAGKWAESGGENANSA